MRHVGEQYGAGSLARQRGREEEPKRKPTHETKKKKKKIKTGLTV